MYRFPLKLYVLISVFSLPLLTYVGVPWLSIFGVTPCWIVLWLLPWSIKQGEVSGIFVGCLFGFLLDSFNASLVSQVPILMFLGFWWGRLGGRGTQIENSFVIGLLAWIGAFLFGLSYWMQTVFKEATEFSFNFWGVQTLLAQSFITSLLAPLICGWILLLWRPRSSL